MTLVSNVYLTHGLMLLCALAAAYSALPESTRRIVPEWQPAVTALLAALSALALLPSPAQRAATCCGSISTTAGV